MKSLSSTQIKQYQDKGFVAPIEALSQDEANEVKDEIEFIEKKWPKELEGLGRNNVHYISPIFDKVVHNSKILDAVEDVIGKNILVGGTTLFIKDPDQKVFVSFHQDAKYIGFEPYNWVTAWLAITDANEENGCMRMWSGTHKDDLKNGLWYTKDLDTRDIHYEEYRDDKFIVRYTEHYYPNYQLKEKYAYQDSLPHGKWIGYYKDGETKHVKRFEDGKKQGKWQFFTEGGDVHTFELYENDKRNSEWYKTGEGKDIYYQFWDMDSLISEYADLHYPNGQLIEKISYKEGLKNGKFTGYFQNGAKKYVKRYENDEPEGKWQYYTMAGKTNAEEIYEEGKRNEEWYRIDEIGDTYYQYWDMDSLISEYADLH